MENIGLFLTKSNPKVITQLLEYGVKGDSPEKLFYGQDGDSNLYITLYPFEDEDQEIVDEVSSYTTIKFRTVIGIDIGRSPQSWFECMKLVSHLYKSFPNEELLIDDSMDGYWTIEEIKQDKPKEGIKFLSQYLSEEERKRVVEPIQT